MIDINQVDIFWRYMAPVLNFSRENAHESAELTAEHYQRHRRHGRDRLR